MQGRKIVIFKTILAVCIPIIVLVSAFFILKFIQDVKVQDKIVNAVKEETPQKEETVNKSVYVEPVVVAAKKEETFKIEAVGDILLGRGVGMRLENQKKGYIYPFEKVADLLKKGDIVFGNLEESITDSTNCLIDINQGGKYVLKNKLEAINGLKYAGFNLFNIANNHILDYYDKGLFDTMDLLDKNSIAHSGAGKNMEEARKPAVIEKRGVKVGMLSYTDMSEVVYKGNPPISFIAGKNKAGVAPKDYNYIKEDVGRIRKSVDLLIVSLHWGKEESFDVLPEQRDLAKKLLDDGVDIVLGHHPHQFQGIELYKGKPIVYSMGNFIFDQNDPENQEGFILNFEYTGKKLSSFTATPIRTVEKTQVFLPAGVDAISLLKRELDLSLKLESKCEIRDDKLVFNLN